jgi:hypothetical protein
MPPDVFKYHKFEESQAERSEEVRVTAQELADLFDTNLPKSREQALAFTKLEEAVMWANKSISKE